jgi:hypothetical protein
VGDLVYIQGAVWWNGSVGFHSKGRGREKRRGTKN